MTSPQIDLLADIQNWRDRFDNASLERIHNRMRPLIEWHIGKKFGSLPDEIKEDLTDTALAKCLSKLATYDETKSNVTTWVCRIAYNTCVDHLRKKPPGQLPETDIQVGPPQTRLLSPEEIDQIQAYLPFATTDTQLNELLDIFLDHRGQPSKPAVITTTECLDAHRLPWRQFGSADDITSLIFALIRWCKLTDTDIRKLQRICEKIPATSGFGLLGHAIGAERLAMLLFLFGGTYLAVPDPAKLLAYSRKKRR